MSFFMWTILVGLRFNIKFRTHQSVSMTYNLKAYFIQRTSSVYESLLLFDARLPSQNIRRNLPCFIYLLNSAQPTFSSYNKDSHKISQNKYLYNERRFTFIVEYGIRISQNLRFWHCNFYKDQKKQKCELQRSR